MSFSRSHYQHKESDMINSTETLPTPKFVFPPDPEPMDEHRPVLTYAIQNFDQTGPRRAPYLICKGFVEAGWQTGIVTRAIAENEGMEQAWDNVPVERVAGRNKRRQIHGIGQRLWKRHRDRFSMSWVWDWHCFYLAAAKCLKGNPYAIVMDTFTYKGLSGARAHLWDQIRYGFVLRNASVILAETPECLAAAQKHFRHPICLLIPTCLWEKDLRSAVDAWYADGNLPEQAPRILYTGRLIRRKNIHHLFTAFERLAERYPEWSIEIRGVESDPKYVAELRAQVAASPLLRDKVRFLAPLYDEAQLYRAYSEASIFCLPSEGEGFPTVVLEAMYFGCAIIAGDSGYVGYQLERGECGLLHTPGDVEQLEKHLETLMSSPARRKEISEKARARMIQTFTWERYFPLIEQTFYSFLAKGRDHTTAGEAMSQQAKTAYDA